MKVILNLFIIIILHSGKTDNKIFDKILTVNEDEMNNQRLKCKKVIKFKYLKNTKKLIIKFFKKRKQKVNFFFPDVS